MYAFCRDAYSCSVISPPMHVHVHAAAVLVCRQRCDHCRICAYSHIGYLSFIRSVCCSVNRGYSVLAAATTVQDKDALECIDASVAAYPSWPILTVDSQCEFMTVTTEWREWITTEITVYTTHQTYIYIYIHTRKEVTSPVCLTMFICVRYVHAR